MIAVPHDYLFHLAFIKVTGILQLGFSLCTSRHRYGQDGLYSAAYVKCDAGFEHVNI